MAKPVSNSRSDGDEELALDEAFEEITAKVQAGQAVDIEDYARRLPEQAERLRRLLKTTQAVAALGKSAANWVDSVQPRLSDAEPPSGLLGDFRIVREVGRGGMGVVYEAEQVSLRRRMALKTLPFAAVLDSRQLQRFQNEALAAASLRHPNIVQVHSVGCERGVHYYAMDYVEGQTLAELIRQLRSLHGPKEHEEPLEPPSVSPLTQDLLSGRFAPAREKPGVSAAAADSAIAEPERVSPSAETNRAVQARRSTERHPRDPGFFRSVANWGIQAAEALEHAHQLGVVHRDIKPSNLMIDTEGRLFITDFGLAQTQTGANLTMTGDVLGTLRYMSPEQAAGRGRVLDHHTDI